MTTSRPTHTEADTSSPTDGGRDAIDAAARQWLHRRLKPVAPWSLGVAACGILSGWLVIAQAGLIAAIVVAVLVDERPYQGLILPLAALLAVMVFRAGLAWGREFLAAEAATRVRGDTRRLVASHLYGLGPVGVASLQSGQLATVLLDQVDALGNYAARFRPQLAQAVFVPLGILLAVALLDWLAALLLLLAAPLIPLFMALVGMGAAAVNRGQFQALARLSGHFMDRLQGLPVLKHYGLGAQAAADIEQASDAYRRRTMAVLRVAFLSSAVLEFFSAVAIAMIAIYIGLGLLGYQQIGPAASLTLYSGLFILLLAPDFFGPLRDLGQHYHDRAAALGAAAELAPLLARPAPAVVRSGTMPPPPGPPRIHLAEVNARYADGPAALTRPVTLSVDPGTTCLLVGPSGCGKSTLLALITGFLRPSEGSVSINGHPLAAFRSGGLESITAWLGQTPHLLPGTIRENILLGRPDADDAAIDRAATAAGVTRFTEYLPDGLDSRVGERGHGLSGGEAQRVALARALIRRPRILLLDEPTASLDPRSRELILGALERVAGETCTVIVATHQPGQFPWADRQVHLA